MALSTELINAFVKATNDKTESKHEATVYGTVFITDGVRYVKLDGSNELTPVSSLVTIADGDRVKVTIKDHRATVTGNVTSISASADSVIEVSSKADTLNANKVDTTDLNAVVARVEILETDSATIKNLEAAEARIDELDANVVTINESLTAQDASIKTLDTEKLDADTAEITYATIANLDATNAKVYNLESTYGDFQVLTTDKLAAVDASIDDLTANKLSAKDAEITYAKITELEAAVADIDVLESDVATIDTLIFGSASGNTIQTSFANAVIAQLGNAQIKSAMIENVSADKITAGDIITNNVRVKSQNGLLLISDETIQISDDARVRVQIGKDAANDYSINVWDADGNLMFSKGGITDSAIKQAIIRNDMVSDTANIAAHKLDIDSLFEEINGSTNTIKSTQIHLNDENQTLDVAFKELSTEVTDLGETVTSQGTQISTIQGQITSKIWQQDIDTATNEMSTQYSTLEQEVNSFKSTVSETYATKTDLDDLEIGGRNYVLNSNEEKHIVSYYTTYSMVDTRTALQDKNITVSFEAKRSEDSDTVNMYAYFRNSSSGALTPGSNRIGDITTEYKRYVVTIEPGVTMSDATHIAINTNAAAPDVYVRNVKVESGNKATDWTAAPEDIDAGVAALEERVMTAETAISQNTDAIALRATKTDVTTAKSEAISSANANTANLLTRYSTTEEMDSAIQLKADSITSSVSSTYATKASVESISIGGKNLLKDSRHVLLYSNNDSTIPITRTLMTENGREFYRYTRTDIESNPTLLSLYSGIPVTQLTEKIFGNEVTFSWLVRCSHETTADMMAWMRVNGTNTELPSDRTVVSVGTEWKRMSFTETIDLDYEMVSTNVFRANARTFTIPDGEIENFYVDVCEWKIEKGNKATDWTVCPDDITLVDSIDIGGRNLVLDSEGERSFTNVIAQWNLSDYGMTNIKNKAVTISFDAYTDEIGTAFDFYLRGVTDNNTVMTSEHTIQNGITDSYARYSATIDISDVEYQTFAVRAGKNSIAANKSSTATYYIKNVKVETGHKPTDWTAAPEELETRVTSAESSITQLSNKITSNVTETTKLGTRMTTVEQTAEDLTVEVNDAAKTATNYLNFSSSGLVVGDHTKSSLGKNVLIDSDSVDIRNGTTVMASFGANKVTLGRNSADSVIDLCDGAGTIKALTSEASTSYPEYDSIEIASQEINTSSQRFVTDVTNSYGVASTPSIQNDAQIYMLSDKSSAGSFARMEAMCTTTSTGAEMSAGVSAITYDKYSTTRTMVYAHDSTDTANRSNQVNVYPHKTTMNRPLFIDGTEFTGSNKVLWSGGYYMSASQTATLSEAISSQANGIVLVWSYYTDGANDNSNFHFKYIPKHFVSLHNGKGTAMLLSNASLSIAAGKYVYISNTSITGYSTNDDSATAGACGLTSTPKNFVLRYVIGV